VTKDVNVIAVQRGDLTEDILSAGNLAFSVTERPAFEIGGTVGEVPVDAGDRVKKGQLLARLSKVVAGSGAAANRVRLTVSDTLDWDAYLAAQKDTLTAAERTVVSSQRAVAQAQVGFKSAEVALAQAKLPTGSQASGLILDPITIQVRSLQVDLAKANLDDAIMAVTTAEQALVKAQKTYDEAVSASPEVVAPFDGIIIAVNVVGGQAVFKGQVAAVIADPTKYEATLFLGQFDVLKLDIGTPATIAVTAITGVTVTGKVTTIAPTSTTSGNLVTYRVTVELDPTDVQLKQGLSVTVDIQSTLKKDVLLAPINAIVSDGAGTFVQMAGTNAGEKRQVTIGLSNSQYCEITSGLKEGEQVTVFQ
jgi:multidrug efflux pump subunit AcrA (membrane-fusion protein)